MLSEATWQDVIPAAEMTSSRSRLAVDAQGKLEIHDSQDDLDTLLCGNEQDVTGAREQVRTLVIKDVRRIPEESPELPSLQDLTIIVDGSTLESLPRVLRADALPAL